MKQLSSTPGLTNETKTKFSESHEQVLREIIFLLYAEKNSKEIAEVLCFSNRTIEKYREHAFELCGSTNLTGIIKYAIESGIHNDEKLINKFKDKFEK